MSSAIDQIISVRITKESISVSAPSFNLPLIAAEFAPAKTTPAFTRVRAYASLADILKEGWTTADEVYKAALAVFSQPSTVKKVFIGRRDATDADWATALTAMQNENDEWFGLAILPTSLVEADVLTEQLEVAAWIETQKKITVMQTTDADALDSAVTNDAVSQIAAFKRTRTALIFRTLSKRTEFADAAWLGKMFGGYEVGEATWAYKQLGGCTPDALTVGQKDTLHGKGANTFATISGINVTEKGVVTSGEFIDVIVGIDWLGANIQTTVFGALAKLPKMPYDDGGITATVGLVKQVMSQAAAMGIIQAKTISVTAPSYEDIAEAQRNSRNLPDVTFTALLQGAIQTVQISGTVSV